MPKRTILTSGDAINGIVFIKDMPYKRDRKCLFKCSCGRNFITTLRCVVKGTTKSCGCWGAKSRSLRFTRHGLRQHPLYRIWCGIKTRCYNKNREDYRYYGGMGIILSAEFHDFKTWFDYVESLPLYEKRSELKLTIDRIDVTKNYERGNLRWATRLQQSLNQRRNCAYS